MHTTCRKNFTEKNRIIHDTKESVSERPSVTLRSATPLFNFREHCLFCGTPAKYKDKNNKRGYDVFPVRTTDFAKTISDICDERNDDWGNEVAGRLAYAPDLHAADAVYHQRYSVNFHTLKVRPEQTLSSGPSSSKCRSTTGRPETAEREQAFRDSLVLRRK